MSTSEQQETTSEERRVSVLMEVSNTMVRLHKQQFGRGPTSARTNWAGSDMLVCVLEDTLTPADRNLVKMGEHQRLRDMRSFFQYSSVREFCGPVERATGRKVRAFLSAIDTEADGFVTEVKDSVAGTITAAYGPDGQLTKQTLPGGLELRIGYDTNRNPVELAQSSTQISGTN